MKTVQHSVVRKTHCSTLVSYSKCVYSMREKHASKSLRTVLCVSVYVLYVKAKASPFKKKQKNILILGYKLESPYLCVSESEKVRLWIFGLAVQGQVPQRTVREAAWLTRVLTVVWLDPHRLCVQCCVKCPLLTLAATYHSLALCTPFELSLSLIV